MKPTDVVILGAGAAGLMCAIRAGRRGRRVVVIEHNATIGEKIRISGGGRCNFTNLRVEPNQFISSNPDFVRSPLARFSSADFIDMVRRHNIPFHEKKSGQLFCDGSATEIIAMLRKECRDANVEIVTGREIDSVTNTNGRYNVCTSPVAQSASPTDAVDISFSSASLVVATGGLSVPKLGASDLGYRIAQEFRIAIIAPRPGLVPLTLSELELRHLKELSGVSVDVSVSCNGTEFREAMLFTHRGLSGPAVLQISSYWRKGDALNIDFLPDVDIESELLASHPPATTTVSLLSRFLPKRFAQAFCTMIQADRKLNQCNRPERLRIASLLHKWTVVPRGTEGFEKAEVTVGGVDTKELSSKTMECKRMPGLFFIGEVVDVTGWLGGYNFQWAWASGVAAGDAV